MNDEPLIDTRKMECMTLRDWFAGMAMQGLYACPVQIFNSDGTPAACPSLGEDMARLAYQQADAMMKERAK